MTCRRAIWRRGIGASWGEAPAWGPTGREDAMAYDIRCRGGGRCDQCAGRFEPNLCDDPLLRALKKGCAGFVTDPSLAALPYPYSCLRFREGLEICPLAWLDNMALRTW